MDILAEKQVKMGNLAGRSNIIGYFVFFKTTQI
jgi:hypothetical protein